MESGTKIWYAPHMHTAYGDNEINKVMECLNRGWLAGYGDMTVEFEEKISNLFGKKYGIFVNSGSSAILLGLSVIDIKKGDEIITPACTFATTVAPIVQLGATPIFCDVEIDTFVPSIETVLSLITDKTKCILLPNLAGSKPDWSELRKRVPKGVILFEDSADTITFTPESDISVTSFYTSHIITAGGAGGMLMLNDELYRNYAYMYRDWGRVGDNTESFEKRFNYMIDNIQYDFKFLYGVVGYNFKCSEMNAAFGLGQLENLEMNIAIRQRNFNRYCERLQYCQYIKLPKNTSAVWLAMPLLVEKRCKLLNYLEENNVQTRVFFSGNITRHRAYRRYFEPFTNSDKIMRDGCLLGLHQCLSLNDIDRVCDLILMYYEEKSRRETY